MDAWLSVFWALFPHLLLSWKANRVLPSWSVLGILSSWDIHLMWEILSKVKGGRRKTWQRGWVPETCKAPNRKWVKNVSEARTRHYLLRKQGTVPLSPHSARTRHSPLQGTQLQSQFQEDKRHLESLTLLQESWFCVQCEQGREGQVKALSLSFTASQL